MRFLSSLSISYKNANVDLIERARLKDPDLALRRLASREGVSEAMLLQTCNRVELYTISGSPDALARFANDEGMPPEAMIPASDDDCMRAVMRLACGLESMIVGEDQILGQLESFVPACGEEPYHGAGALDGGHEGHPHGSACPGGDEDQ